MTDNTKPEYLYHYTDAAGLVGIVQGKMFWASGLRYMNDVLEDKFADQQAAQFIRKRGLQIKDNEQQRIGMNLVADKINEDSSQTYTFAVSMSEEPDLLSQWRAYTPEGGYSIGFFFESIKEIARHNNFTLAKCVYKVDEREKLIAERIENYLDSIQNWAISDQESEKIANI